LDCTRVDQELVAFHLAALDGATRAGVEAHLAGCARCVSAYLALKRAIDAGEDAGAAPSEMTRKRIFAAAAAQLTVDARPSTGSERGRPRRAAWTAMAVAAVVLMAAPFVWKAVQVATKPTVTPAGPAQEAAPAASRTVDTARTTPENLAYL
jgi:Putative zinc-finger